MHIGPCEQASNGKEENHTITCAAITPGKHTHTLNTLCSHCTEKIHTAPCAAITHQENTHDTPMQPSHQAKAET